MLKNNRDKAISAVNLTILIFLAVSAVFGGWPSVGSSASDKDGIKQAVADYYEQMPDNSYKITEPDLKNLVDAKDTNIYILDIRENKDFAAGHIEGAHNIPFRQIGSSLDKLPTDKEIIVYCYTGQTAGQTTSLLNVAGFKARALNGGMNNGWAKAGYPVVAEN